MCCERVSHKAVWVSAVLLAAIGWSPPRVDAQEPQSPREADRSDRREFGLLQHPREVQQALVALAGNE